MERDTTEAEHGALLVVEIGTDTTRVTLIDVVDQSYRLVARAVQPSSYEPPANDPTRAIVAALKQIEATAARELLRGDDLLFPQNEAGNGVDGVVVTTNVAAPVNVAVAGLAEQASVRSATHAARSTYTTLVDTIALDAGGKGIGQHVSALAERQPDVIIVAGGTENGATAPGVRLAQMVGLVARHSPNHPLIVYAGNSATAEQIRTMIGDATRLEIVENVRPQPDVVRIEPTRAALRNYYREHRLAELPGADRLKQMRVERIGSVAEDQGLMTRFLAQRFERNVLALSVDGATTACLIASGGHYSESIWGRLGVRQGAMEVFGQRGAANITRWLPYEIDENALHNRLLNRLLRPRQVPTDLDDLLLDYALLREAASVAYTALRDERPDARYDLVIAAGTFADAPRPGLALLALLDALQPTSRDSELAINMYLDQFGLLAASGALAHLNTDAASCLLEMDALNNTPLATVIVPRGELVPGKQVAEIELTPLDGPPITRTVNVGEIARLPLARGKRGTLRIRPANGIAIGPNQPGTEVLSDEAAIVGSALGVVIDARPRPLALPTELEQRRTMLVGWMNALDALPSLSAFAPPVEAATNSTPADVAAAPSDGAETTSASATPADDVAALREGLVMQPQPKRGFFRRK